MSDSGKAIFPDFGKLVPGFDFLQNLTKQASGAASSGMPKMPNLGSWVAPTLNVEELDRRIQELKAVQFWLDQNATALKATIQALEVQKMTLSALQGMNVNMADMAKAFQMPDASNMGGMKSGMAAATDLANTMASNMASTMAGMTGMAGKAGQTSESSNGSRAFGAAAQDQAGQTGQTGQGGTEKVHHHFAGLEVPETGFMRREHAREQARGDEGAVGAQGRGNGAAQADQGDQSEQDQQARDPTAEAAKVGAGMAAAIDPMQWWGALTQQFQTIANSALQDVSQRKPFEASQSLAQDALRTAGKTASDFAETASKTLIQSASSARDLMTGALNVGDGWPMPGASTGTSSGASSGAGKRGASRSASPSNSRRAAPARAGAMASDDKASGRGKASASASGKTAKAPSAKATKTAKTAKSIKSIKSIKATTGRARAEGKAETKSSRSASSGRSAPQARGGASAGAASRGGKARSTTAARKTSPRAR